MTLLGCCLSLIVGCRGESNVVSIMDFGAVADGVTDNAKAINGTTYHRLHTFGEESEYSLVVLICRAGLKTLEGKNNPAS